MDVQELVRQLLSTAIILAVLGYVARKVAEQWLSARLEQHKSDLNHASATALETLRYDLRISEARQSRLLARQAAIIAGVFARLERLYEALRILAAPIRHQDGGPRPLVDAAVTAYNDFVLYYHQRAIWLDISITEQINDLDQLFRRVLREMDYNLQNDAIADRGKWIETYGRLQTEIPQARAALDRQFRTLLGVTTPAPPLTPLTPLTPPAAVGPAAGGTESSSSD